MAQAAWPSLVVAQRCEVVHPLAQQTPGFYVVELPAAALAFAEASDAGREPVAFRRGAPGYPRSLRLFGKTADGDTVQMPFVSAGVTEAPPVRSLPQINAGLVGEATRFTVELPDRPLIDRIQLVLGNQNFEGRVQLEGSDVPGDWQTLLRSARILDISQGVASYRYTNLRFGPTAFRYYRITISGIEQLSVLDVQATEAGRADQLRRRYAANVTTLPRVARTKQTQLLIELPEPALLDRVKVYASSAVPFDRPVEVSVAADTALAGDGRLRFRTVATGGGVLARGTLDPITFAESVSALLVATIYDGDDQPLVIDSVVVEGPRRFITTRIDAAEEYWLAYGCDGLGLPDYDLARQRASIPAGLDTLALGEGRVIASADPEPTRSDWNVYLLWGVMVVGGLVIVAVAMRLLRASNTASGG